MQIKIYRVCILLISVFFSCNKLDKAPLVKTISYYNLTNNSVTAVGKIIFSATAVEKIGFCWDTNKNPTISSSHITKVGNNDTFSIDIENMLPNTKYYIRSYAKNAYGVSYGEAIEVTTQVGDIGLTTINITNITGSSVKSGGLITINGGDSVIDRGVCWSLLANPTVNSNKTLDGQGTGSFESRVVGLSRNTSYHLRAYATNSKGTYYGNDISFTTICDTPIVSTVGSSNITADGVVINSNVISDGGGTIAMRGICWSTTHNPTILLSTKTNDGNGMGSYSSTITNLTPNTVYYFRSYAINAAGAAYGAELKITTSALSLGTRYGGGIITYILQTGEMGYVSGQIHGIIAAPFDQSIGIQWGCLNTFLNDTGWAIGKGQTNTNVIVSNCGVGTAAHLCDTLTLNGFSDWYLPSANELYQIWLNKAIIPGLTSSDYYWSSSEADAVYAIIVGFNSVLPGYRTNWGKNGTYLPRVRAVRSF